jgi:hypothetical protein
MRRCPATDNSWSSTAMRTTGRRGLQRLQRRLPARHGDGRDDAREHELGRRARRRRLAERRDVGRRTLGGFYSFSSNLVAIDTNAAFDVFLKDLQTGQTTRVSVDSSGAQASGASSFSAISGDGRYVAFRSDAPDLVAGDANGAVDIFVHDTLTGQTVRASVDSAGVESDGASDTPALSIDGSSVTFYSFATKPRRRRHQRQERRVPARPGVGPDRAHERRLLLRAGRRRLVHLVGLRGRPVRHVPERVDQPRARRHELDVRRVPARPPVPRAGRLLHGEDQQPGAARPPSARRARRA